MFRGTTYIQEEIIHSFLQALKSLINAHTRFYLLLYVYSIKELVGYLQFDHYTYLHRPYALFDKYQTYSSQKIYLITN